MAIPKTIHYCWFGRNSKPKLVEKCIKSWKKHCSDYEIIEWNEDNYSFTQAPLYVRQAYEHKRWAFVTDYVRLDLLYRLGGLYFDTDVEIRKPLDPLLDNLCFMGIEKSTRFIKVNTGLAIGAQAGFPLLKEMMDAYQSIPFIMPDGSFDVTTCTVRNTEVLKRYGYVEKDQIQKVCGAVIYPSDFFSPIEMETGRRFVTRNTYTIHHYSLSWSTPEKRKARNKWLFERKWRDFYYNVRVFPNKVVRTVVGSTKYELLKNKWKKN